MTVALQLNSTGQMMLDQIDQEMTYKLQKKITKSFEEALFCTPEEARAIFRKNLGNRKVDVRINDYGFIDFNIEVGAYTLSNPMRQMTPSGFYVDTAQTNCSITSTTTSGTSNYFSTGTSSTTQFTIPPQISGGNTRVNFAVDGRFVIQHAERLKISDGQEIVIDLPDGTTLKVEKSGNFTVDDKDSKVLYKGNKIREFNRYINSSDLLQDFIRFLGNHGVRQSEVLNVPIELFVNWLILQSAEADGEDAPDNITPVERHPKLVDCKRKSILGKCLRCGRFISQNKTKAGFNFCNIEHAQEHCERFGLAS